jgi:hypothetical protein
MKRSLRQLGKSAKELKDLIDTLVCPRKRVPARHMPLDVRCEQRPQAFEIARSFFVGMSHCRLPPSSLRG